MSLYKLLTPKAFVEMLTSETARRVVPVDSTWYLPNLHKDGKQEFLETERIKGAVFFDIDGIKDNSSKYPHMLPDSKTFNAGMSELGLEKDDVLVVYDRIGNFSAPRCAWTLSVMGHNPVYLLNNFQILKESGYSLDTAKIEHLTPYPTSKYVSNNNFSEGQVASFEDIHDLVKSGEIKNYNLFDARSLPRFKGEAPEPRVGLSSGHIPGAQPMPFTELLDDNKAFPQDNSAMKEKLEQYLKNADVKLDTSKQTIAMCGTGVTGVIIKTALEHAGIPNVKLYDGSWTEWVLRNGEIAKGR